MRSSVGYYVKNRETNTNNLSNAIRIPAGASIERPTSPIFGQIRFNTTVACVEFYDGTLWTCLTKHGNTELAVDSFTGDGSTTVFTPMTNVIAASDNDQILVFVGNIYQIPTTNYTTNGTSDITFTSAPGNGLPINVIHNLNSTTVT